MGLDMLKLDQFRGCLLGGAVGDALGAGVEFISRREILHRHGPEGIDAYAPTYGRLGAITDDTQMTLFTAEGLLRAWTSGGEHSTARFVRVTANAYLRWLRTQGLQPRPDAEVGAENPGWLLAQPALHATRAPGNTCLAALRSLRSIDDLASNDSKGCGGVMRMAPVGLFMARLGVEQAPERAFELGLKLAAITHGHPTGQLPAGVLAVLVLCLVRGQSLEQGLAIATDCLRARPQHEETLAALELAQSLSVSTMPRHDAVARLGEGWIAEEALAISVYCALVARDFRDGVRLAVNHDGDSDSTGAITGNLLGARLGVAAIPQDWLEPLELREVIEQIADDLHAFPGWEADLEAGDGGRAARIRARYPEY
jgi:ADP-ribosylglycohydrolase